MEECRGRQRGRGTERERHGEVESVLTPTQSVRGLERAGYERLKRKEGRL